MVLKKSYVSLWKKITIIYLSFLASSWNLLVVPCCWILRLLFCWRISLCCRCQCHLSEDDVNIPVSYMTNDSRKECPLNSLTFTWLFPHLLSSLWLNDTLFPIMCQLRLLLPLERAAFRSSQYQTPSSKFTECEYSHISMDVNLALLILGQTLPNLNVPANASEFLWRVLSSRAEWMWEHLPHPLLLTLSKRWLVLS